MKARAEILVSGLVQGVFFRDFTRQNARKLGLFGWVKNLADGRVYVVVEGEKEKIIQLMEKLKQGPPQASVEAVQVDWQKFIGEFNDFEIRW
jgi:acylphosphatase|uniref:Acylphosphatase n=1 Tax=candidate division WOR-3 bacterium TaxID=2052148 RepID=A0A7C6EBD9_UNCW3